MRKNYLFLPAFVLLVTITILGAFYSAKTEIPETVFAQYPIIVGCYQRVDPSPKECTCSGGLSPGNVDSAENGEGTGTQGIRITTATCETSGLKGDITCLTDVGLPAYNVFCETPTPTPTPTPRGGGCGSGLTTMGEEFEI